MKVFTSFCILLVILLGCICVSPTKSLNYEDAVEDTQSQQQLAKSSAPSPSNDQQPEIKNNAETEAETEQPNSKRTLEGGLGMPSTSSREMSLPPEQVASDISTGRSLSISEPANQPGSYQGGSSESSLTEGPNDKSSQPDKPADSSQPRGFGSDFMSALNGGASGQQQHQQQQASSQVKGQTQGQQSNSQLQSDQIKAEDLPTIIENKQSQNQDPRQASSQQSSKADAQGSPTAQNGNGNATAMISSARTFDSWTNCVGSASNKYGTCKNDVECSKFKGKADGSCMGGLGVCCVMALSCNDKSHENNTFFANPDFPEPSWEARQCQVELVKKHAHILQIMIEFDEFELAPPNHDGECITDVFRIGLASGKPSPYSLLRICGQNTGQHLYLDVSQIDEPLVLSVATSGGGFPRRWSIRIVQMDKLNFLLAPPGCLQYYTDTVGHFRSFNLGKNLKNLYYAICFRIDNGYSGIRFTDNFFGMNGPFCRKKPVAIGGGRYNGSIEAHPHHLVIPPPGYVQPIPHGQYPPQPLIQHSYGPTHQPGRYKRHAPTQAAPVKTSSSPGPSQGNARTFGTFGLFGEDKSIEHKKHDEHKSFEFAKEHQPYYPPPPPPAYPNPYMQRYGQYGMYNLESKGDYKGDFKGEYKDELKEKEASKWFKPGWFGWASKSELHEGKGYEKGYENGKFSHYGPHYGGMYGQPYSGYGPHYGTPYKSGYHHKEIDKFGEKYDHLEYKHEKNHHLKGGKEHEKSGWFGWWGKKEGEKDKEKFFQHHEALFPMMHIPEMPHCEPRYCGQNDEITFPPSGDSIAEMCGNRFNRGRGPKIISGSPLVVYVSNRGVQRGAGFDMNYEQVFYIPKPY